MVEDPVLRQRLSFSRTTDPGGTEVLHVEVWLDPGGGVTPHVHPGMEERFEVVSGQPSFLSGRRWRTAGPGETVVVPAGTRHAYRNRSDEVAHMVCHARPPSTLQEFLEEAVALGSAGKIATRWALPTSFGALREALAMAERHRDMAVLLFPPMPPRFVQKLLLPRHNPQPNGN